MNDFRKLVETLDKIQETIEEDVCSNCGEDLWGDCKCDNPTPSKKEEVEEGIFGKKERSIGEIGSELGHRADVRYALKYATHGKDNADAIREMSDEEIRNWCFVTHSVLAHYYTNVLDQGV